MNSSPIEFAACTIIAKNYLPMARILAESWNKVHPGAPLFVLLLDSHEGFFRPEDEEFRTIRMSELEIPNLQGFLFKYSILEASTAVKPYLLRHLFATYSMAKLLYLDPDIEVMGSLDELGAALDDSNILLIPHLTTPMPRDGASPSDHDILQAGTYNLGFLGLRKGNVSRSLLDWWSNKLYHECVIAFDKNLFVDQRWMDLVPGLFGGVRVWRDPGYNVAYWNLHERQVSTAGDAPSVNGKPIRFFHYSGFNPDQPKKISKHQNRFKRMSDIGDARHLYARYRRLLIKKGWNDTKKWNYDYNFFANGVPIPPEARSYYWSLGPDVEYLGDPFTWLEEAPRGPAGVSKLLRRLARVPFGMNVMGYLNSEKGTGEAGRSNLRIVQAASLPCVANVIATDDAHNVEQIDQPISKENPYAVNLITVNADQFVNFAREHESYMRNRYNIGYWAWEMPEFPAEWATSFAHVDEVWTPSRFTRDAIAASSPVPVRVLPHSIDPQMSLEPRARRSQFGIAADTFVFLFLFDFHSFMERKNPLGLIAAYKNAFGSRTDVQLLIKSSHGSTSREELRTLQEAGAGANVRIFDAVLSRDEKHDLMMLADCYVSLHRSEGFGLTMAEAMLCGKPVIATGYSGNIDFMTPDTSFLVPYKIITVDRDHGPYKAGFHWAQPDLDYAADAMRHVEAHRDIAAATGQKARKHVWNVLHPSAIAKSMLERFQELGLGNVGESMTALDRTSKAQMSPVQKSVHLAKLPVGFNVAGYLASEKGVGEIARSALRIVDAAKVPSVANNIVDSGSQNLESLPSTLSEDNPYAINLVAVNAEQLPGLAASRAHYFDNRFNIGYWAWELSEFPMEWEPAFDHLDEVWTLSEFARDSIAASSPIPVQVVHCSLDLDSPARISYGRDRYGIPEDMFVFLFFFDFHSFIERKNPIGLVQAFKKAFGSRRDVQLLIKSSHSREHLDQLQALEQTAAGANVRVYDEVLSKDVKQGLMMASDCYVSLHRSEGFGLTIAEAMLCGKPAVATDYSGNCDFLSAETGFPVPYKLVDIERDHGPYRAGQRWAQPDLDYAADVLRYIESNRDSAAEVGSRARAHVSHLLSPVTIGRKVRGRLQELGYLQDAADVIDSQTAEQLARS
jgi:glycosyltransferase involved in cell wall biosynthesis